MLRLKLTIFIIFAMGFAAPVYAAGCNPDDNEVAFFQHSNYRGICIVLGIGNYINSKAMRMENDSISSFVVGKNVQVMVCNHASNVIVGSGWFSDPHRCQTFRSSMKSLGNTRVGNDTISSAKIVAREDLSRDIPPGPCYPGDASKAVAVYQHPNFGGACRVLGVGSYENSETMNFKNDSISSIEFARYSGVKVRVCQHSNFKGRCEELRATDLNLYDNRIGDNSISSIKVTMW